jgi:LysM repeat protein
VPSRTAPYTEVQWSDVDGEERENFNIVTVGEDQIEYWMYLLDPMDEETEEYNFDAWTVFDHFVIPNNLTGPIKTNIQSSPPPAESNAVYYIIVRGDWLSRIAPKYGTTWEKLAELNNIGNPDLIYPGQILRIE